MLPPEWIDSADRASRRRERRLSILRSLGAKQPIKSSVNAEIGER